MTLGDKIKRLRQERGWDQKELADRVGITNATISRYETGTIKEISKLVIITLSQIFGVSELWLWDEDQEWPPRRRLDPDEEATIVEAYRQADDRTRDIIKKILDIN